MKYLEFIKSKKIIIAPSGFNIGRGDLHRRMFPFQKALTKWALSLGKAALFEDCGLGKTIQQIEWARCVCEYTGGNVLILAPLAVSEQTRREGEKFGIGINIVAENSQVKPGINITNYEKLHKFDCSQFDGVVLDESSILKNFAGKIRNQLIDSFRATPYKLCCTATPSPNDYTELGNTAEFLGVMARSEMMSMFFVNDSGNTTAPWRLKGHAEKNKFWEWLSSWAVMIRKPSDIGFSDEGFELPELRWHQHVIPYMGQYHGMFVEPATTLGQIRVAMRESIVERCEKAAEIQDENQWLYWCNLNDESTALTKQIDGAVEVAGRHTPDQKTAAMLGFSEGKIKTLVTKPKIAGFGMNWQNCNNMAFVGLSHSYEALYQAVRRCWRFGQKKQVDAHIIIGEKEGNVLRSILRKERDMEVMHSNMILHMSTFSKQQISAPKNNNKAEYSPTKKITMPNFLEK